MYYILLYIYLYIIYILYIYIYIIYTLYIYICIYLYIYSDFYKIVNFSVFNVPPKKSQMLKLKKKHLHMFACYYN